MKKSISIAVILLFVSSKSGEYEYAGNFNDVLVQQLKEIQKKDHYTFEHCLGVKRLAHDIGDVLNLSVEDMKHMLNEAHEADADIAKLAVLAHTKQDVLNVLQATANSEKPVCTIAMGEIGKHSRIVAPCYGSCLTYGVIAKAVAPGQIKIHELKSAMEILF